MNIANLSYSEIQNLRIQADIESYKAGKTVSMFDVMLKGVQPQTNTRPVQPKPKPVQKPLPFHFPEESALPPKRDNSDMRIKIRNHQENVVHNFLLVKESTLVNPDKNIISTDSAIGKILRTSELGDTFTCNDIDYTVLDIFPTPKKHNSA